MELCSTSMQKQIMHNSFEVRMCNVRTALLEAHNKILNNV